MDIAGEVLGASVEGLVVGDVDGFVLGDTLGELLGALDGLIKGDELGTIDGYAVDPSVSSKKLKMGTLGILIENLSCLSTRKLRRGGGMLFCNSFFRIRRGIPATSFTFSLLRIRWSWLNKGRLAKTSLANRRGRMA
jgi:hypothetical protein